MVQNFKLLGIFLFFSLEISLISNLNINQPPADKPPEISVSEIITGEDYSRRQVSDSLEEKEYFYEVENDIIVGSNTVGITLKCTATYPVFWTVDYMDNKFVGDDYLFYNDISTFTSRVGNIDKDPPEKWSFTATLLFQGMVPSMSRNYACRSAQDKSIGASRYIFFEELSKNYLIYAGEWFNISLNSKQKEITTPCRIISRDTTDIQMRLFKEKLQPNESIWEELLNNDSISYDPRRGYSLVVTNLPDIMGSYKCTADDSNELDVVYFDIIADKPEAYNNVNDMSSRKILHGSATVYIDYTIGAITCCSSVSDRKPTLKMFLCASPSECDIMRPLTASKKLQSWLKHHYFYNSLEDEKNCTQQLYTVPSFLLQCEGDGIDVLQEYSYYFRNSTEAFSGYYPRKVIPSTGFTFYEVETEKIDRQQQILITSKLVDYNHFHENPRFLEREKGIYYSGEQVSFYCFKSVYIFSHGGFWNVTWKNGTIKSISSNSTSMYGGVEGISEIELVLDINMLLISCHVPVWNTTEWVSKSLELKVEDPVAPGSKNGQKESIYWMLNDTNRKLECEFFGRPTPTIVWTKDGQNLDSEAFPENQNGSKGTLQFVRQIAHDIHGEYSCNATNLGGSSVKIFSVFVKESQSSYILMTMLAVILVLAACGVLGVIWWKFKLNRKALHMEEAAVPSYLPSERPSISVVY